MPNSNRLVQTNVKILKSENGNRLKLDREMMIRRREKIMTIPREGLESGE